MTPIKLPQQQKQRKLFFYQAQTPTIDIKAAPKTTPTHATRPAFQLFTTSFCRVNSSAIMCTDPTKTRIPPANELKMVSMMRKVVGSEQIDLTMATPMKPPRGPEREKTSVTTTGSFHDFSLFHLVRWSQVESKSSKSC